MKVFGHPVHPLLVHFPTALLPADGVLSYLYCTLGNASYYQAGAYCLWAGAGLGLLTMLTGLIDSLSITKDRKGAIALALYHGFVNGLLILIFAVIAFKSWQVFPRPHFVNGTGVLIKGILILGLFVGNYIGGSLVYKYRVGVNFKTKKDERSAT